MGVSPICATGILPVRAMPLRAAAGRERYATGVISANADPHTGPQGRRLIPADVRRGEIRIPDLKNPHESPAGNHENNFRNSQVCCIQNTWRDVILSGGRVVSLPLLDTVSAGLIRVP